MFMEALEASSASGRGGGIMKFIHTGDVHWGMTPDADKPWGKERAQAIRDTFKAIIDHAGAVKADCLFISGDLFHRQPLMRDIKEVNYLFPQSPCQGRDDCRKPRQDPGKFQYPEFFLEP